MSTLFGNKREVLRFAQKTGVEFVCFTKGMNELQVFTYGGNKVRTVQRNGEPWFVLKDVCDILSLTDTNKISTRLDQDELTRIKFVSGGQSREMLCINESGLYNVILRSDKRGKLLPYEAKNDGLFELKESYNDKTQWSGTQTLITPKGRETFRLLMIG